MPNFKVFRADDGAVIIVMDNGSLLVSPEDVTPLIAALVPPEDVTPLIAAMVPRCQDDLPQKIDQEPALSDKPEYIEEVAARYRARPSNWRKRLTEQTIGEVARRYRSGESADEIGAAVGRSGKSIQSIISSYLKHLPRHRQKVADSVTRYHDKRREALGLAGGDDA